MIHERKSHAVEVRDITHSGTFSTRSGMVQGEAGDKLVYDPAKTVYLKGENPRDNAHNWDLVKKAEFEKEYEDTGADHQLPPVPTDLGVHQFDDDGKFLGYKSQAELDAEVAAAKEAAKAEAKSKKTE